MDSRIKRAKKTFDIADFVERYKSDLAAIGTQLAQNFEVPAQRTINAGFARMRVDRFTRSGDDLYEMATAFQNGWEYRKPPSHLVARWACA